MSGRTSRFPVRRLEAAGVLVLSLAMLALSGSVALREPVWSPLDEVLHHANANTVLTEHRWPSADHPVTVGGRGLPGGSMLSWEATQPPLNYLVLAGAEAVVLALRPKVSGSGEVRALRLTNSVFFALLVLLLWLAARRLAPGNLAFAWALPATAFLWRGTVFDVTRVGNDVLVAVLVSLAIVLTLRWRDSPRARAGAAVGLVIGLAVLCKYTGLFAAVPVALLLVARPLEAAADWRRRTAFVLAMGAACAAVVGPWLLFMRHRYGDLTGASAYRRVLPSIVVLPPVSPGELWDDARSNVFLVLFGQLPFSPLRHPDAWLQAGLPLAVGALALGGLATLMVVRRGRAAAADRLVLAASAPAMLALLLVLSIASNSPLLPLGRYDLPAVLPVGVVLAAGPGLLVPRRLRTPVALMVLCASVALAAHDVLLPTWAWV